MQVWPAGDLCVAPCLRGPGSRGLCADFLICDFVTLTDRFQHLKAHLPDWIQDWLDIVLPAFQILLIVVITMSLHRLLRRIILRASDHYQFPHELLLPINAVIRWLLISAALMLVLERLGVSASVLWAAFTGFATVGAVAFFAAWSVLSNLFCAFLIFIVGPFRVGDYVEVLDAADKPGVLGRVIDINLLFTTLEDASETGSGAWLKIPNTMIFQKVIRHWRGMPPASRLHIPPQQPAASAADGTVPPALPATPAPVR